MHWLLIILAIVTTHLERAALYEDEIIWNWNIVIGTLVVLYDFAGRTFYIVHCQRTKRITNKNRKIISGVFIWNGELRLFCVQFPFHASFGIQFGKISVLEIFFSCTIQNLIFQLSRKAWIFITCPIPFYCYGLFFLRYWKISPWLRYWKKRLRNCSSRLNKGISIVLLNSACEWCGYSNSAQIINIDIQIISSSKFIQTTNNQIIGVCNSLSFPNLLRNAFRLKVFLTEQFFYIGSVHHWKNALGIDCITQCAPNSFRIVLSLLSILLIGSER